jgi:hypothetical protein
MLLPRSLSEAKGLKELHLSNCISLRLELIWELVPCLEDLYIETWKSVEGIKIHGHPNLRMFSLSGKWIRCLSLCGCSKLKIVNFSDDLTDLKDVDLSGTALEEVPHNYLISRRIPSDMILIISQLFLYTPLLINAPQNCVRKRKM